MMAIGCRLRSWHYMSFILWLVSTIWTPRWRWSSISGFMHRVMYWSLSRSRMPAVFMTMVMVMMVMVTMMVHGCCAPSTRRRLDYVTIRDTPPVPPMADGKVACKHLVLVHGACIGGWTYFKVATQLRSAGYRVTAPDLGASGVDPRPLREVPTFRDYTAPLLGLLGSLPPGEKVVLVGHSLGGINVALAAELFPDKIAAAVFLCAFMPDHTSRPSHVLEKFIEGKWLDWMDTEFKPQDAEGKLPTSMLFGPQIAQERLMQLCSPEDVTLAGSLLRVSSMFVEDLQKQQPFTEGRYGSVRKVYVVVNQDLAIPEGFQRWMIGNSPVDEVKEIDAADHLVMLSRPDELARCLADIAESYA